MRFIVDATHFVLSFKYREIDWKSPKTWGVVAALALVVFALIWSLSGNEEVVEETVAKRQVATASVAELMGGSAGVSAVAEIKSVSEAKITTEQGGRISRVSATLGSRVGAGQVLAEVDNASQRAAVLQAEGIYEASKAALSKIQGGTREEQLAVLEAGYESAKGGVVNSLLSAYATVDSAVKDTADQMFSGIELGQVQFTVLTSNQTRENELESRRVALSPVLAREASASKTISTSSDLNAELDKTEKEVRDARIFIDTLIAALNDAIPSDATDAGDIAAFKAAASGARSSLTGILSGITGARASLETAKKGLEQGVTGAQSQDVAAVEASVKQAQGAYNGALAALEKTIIRTPISGTLNNFTVKLGDIVSPSQQVAIVSNNNALEAIFYVSENDRNKITIGQTIALGEETATITRVAPALDPVTRRIEVRAGLTAQSKLTNGETVRVVLEKSLTPQNSKGPLAIPLTALRMSGERTFVLKINEGKIAAHDVIIGKISGDSVQVTSGLALEDEIVIDARGLKESQEVDTVAK